MRLSSIHTRAQIFRPLPAARFLRLVLLSVIFLVLFCNAHRAHAQSSTGFRTIYFDTTGSAEPTSEKPQSKLWWNDGFWWGSLWHPSAKRYEIHRFDLATQSWSATGAALDTRSSSRSDVLWDGQRLYVVSNIYTVNAGPTTPGNIARLYRFSYEAAAKSYSLDAGFPVQVNGSKSETLTLDKDSTGKLWITWAEGGKVMLNRTLGDDLTWGEPFMLPTQGASLHNDDISALVAFDQNKIGVMWTNQNEGTLNFSVHADGEADSVWQAREQILSGANIVDDHLSIKAACDNSGAIYAAVKTNLTGATNVGIYVLKRTASGTWSRSVFAEAPRDHLRPALLINHENARLYVFAQSEETGHGRVYVKSASLHDLEFPPGLGATLIATATDLDIRNATATKQCVDQNTGMLVLCADRTTRYYLHNNVDFEADKPVIAAFAPTFGPMGTEVKISGKNFNGAARVSFGEVVAPSFVVESDSVIRVNVPVGAANAPIHILNAIDFGSSSNQFVVTAPPAISSFTPANGPAGAEVTILGSHLSSVTTVFFHNTPAINLQIDSETQVRALVPANATTGAVRVQNPDGLAESASAFVVTRTPVITAFAPQRAQKGAEVIVHGYDFTAATQAAFNNAPADFVLESDSLIRAWVPANATSGKVSVTNSAGKGLSPKKFFKQYALTANVLGRGSVRLEPGGNVYDQGMSVSATALSDSGWKFQDWDGDLDGATPMQTLIMNADKNLTANFTALATFSLSVDTLGSGRVWLDPPGGIYYNGATVTLMPQPDSGYVFSGWQGDLHGYAAPEQVKITSNKSVKAVFTKIPAQRFAKGVWISAEELRQLPTTGARWRALKAEADLPATAPNLANRNDSLNVRVLAKALVYARTGVASYRNEVIQACTAIMGTEQNGETLALGRELAAYVIAADLVKLPAAQDATFRAWLRSVLRDTLQDNRTLQSAHEERPNNWGTHCGASRAAIAAYLGDTAELARTALIFRGWLGNRNLYADFSYGEKWWQADSTAPVGINPAGAMREGYVIDGVLPDDQRRAGNFMWPPPHEDYVYEALQGAVAQAVILHRAGYEVWNWENAALRRAFEWLYEQANFPAHSEDRWQLYLINHFYQTEFATPAPTRPGKNMGWTDWTHGQYYKLAVNLNGAGSVKLSPPGGIYEPGTSVKLTAEAAPNCEFVEWSGAAVTRNHTITVIMSADQQVTASFQTVTADMVKHEESRLGGLSDSLAVSTTTSLTAASEHLYLAAISTRPKVQVTEVTGLGLQWVLVKKQCSGRNAVAVEVWKAQGAPDSNGVVTARFAVAPKSAVITVSRYSGADFVNPIGEIVRGNSAGANGACNGGVDSKQYAFEITPTSSNGLLYGVAAMRNRSHTPGEGFLERIEVKHGASNRASSIAVQDRRPHALSPTSIEGSFSGKVDWAVIALEIKPRTAHLNLKEVAHDPLKNRLLPADFMLSQNYPNPFNGVTTIAYALPQAQRVRIKIFALSGELVRTLVDETQSAGYKRVQWDGKNDDGKIAGSGLYLVELKGEGRRLTKKISLMK